MDDNFRIQWTTIPHLLDESSASLDETSRRTHNLTFVESQSMKSMDFMIKAHLSFVHLSSSNSIDTVKV